MEHLLHRFMHKYQAYEFLYILESVSQPSASLLCQAGWDIMRSACAS